MQLYSPLSTTPKRKAFRAPALASIDGLRIGVLENGKLNAEEMLNELASNQFANLLAASDARSAILSTLVRCVGSKDAALLDELGALVQAERSRLKMEDE